MQFMSFDWNKKDMEKEKWSERQRLEKKETNTLWARIIFFLKKFELTKNVDNNFWKNRDKIKK